MKCWILSLFILVPVAEYGESSLTTWDEILVQALQAQAAPQKARPQDTPRGRDASLALARSAQTSAAVAGILGLWFGGHTDLVEAVWSKQANRSVRALIVALYACRHAESPAEIPPFQVYAMRLTGEQEWLRGTEIDFVWKHQSALAQLLAQVAAARGAEELQKSYAFVAETHAGQPFDEPVAPVLSGGVQLSLVKWLSSTAFQVRLTNRTAATVELFSLFPAGRAPFYPGSHSVQFFEHQEWVKISSFGTLSWKFPLRPNHYLTVTLEVPAVKKGSAVRCTIDHYAGEFKR